MALFVFQARPATKRSFHRRLSSPATSDCPGRQRHIASVLEPPQSATAPGQTQPRCMSAAASTASILSGCKRSITSAPTARSNATEGNDDWGPGRAASQAANEERITGWLKTKPRPSPWSRPEPARILVDRALRARGKSASGLCAAGKTPRTLVPIALRNEANGRREVGRAPTSAKAAWLRTGQSRLHRRRLSTAGAARVVRTTSWGSASRAWSGNASGALPPLRRRPRRALGAARQASCSKRDCRGSNAVSSGRRGDCSAG
jgi:hypothetical protein